MARATSFLSSTIGKKIVMAVTGVIMFVWLILHMAGNLQLFLGEEKFDHYAALIKSIPAALWGMRIGLIACLVAHVWAAVTLTARNKQSRPVNYRVHTPLVSALPGRKMMVSGVILLVFLVYHLSDFTLGMINPGFNHENVYRNIIWAFSQWYLALGYIVAMTFLGWHLYHGTWSFFQTLGLNHPKYNKTRRLFSIGITLLLAIGFSLVPLAVLIRFVK